MRTILCFAMVCWAVLAFGQSGTEKSRSAEFAQEAAKAMAVQDFQRAADYFKKARSINKKDQSLLLKEAEARFFLGQHSEVIRLVQPIAKEKSTRENEAVTALRLYAGSLAMTGKEAAAKKAIANGLENFPKAGELYAEMGLLNLEAGNEAAALTAWEKGMVNATDFPGNYLAAGKLLAKRGDLAWSIIYLEQYLNIKRKGSQSKEASRLIVSFYKQAYRCPEKGECELVFYQTPRKDFVDEEGLFANAPMLHREMGAAYGSDLGQPADLGIHDIYLMLLEGAEVLATRKTSAKRYFEWLAYVEQEGMMEAYVFWLLQDGAPLEFGEWYAEEEDTFIEFERWLARHRMIYTLKEAVVRPTDSNTN